MLTLRTGPRCALKRTSGGFLGLLCVLGPEMLQNEFLEADSVAIYGESRFGRIYGDPAYLVHLGKSA